MRASKKGFTLLEMAVVILIIGLMAAGIATLATVTQRREQQEILQNKLAALDYALITYRRNANRLPCPAQRGLPYTDAGFGKEAGTAGACAAAFSLTSNTVVGVIPVRALGLPDEAGLDPWGFRFTYAVDKRFTGNNAFTTYPITANTGDMLIKSDTAQADVDAKVNNAILTIVSHGLNGHGSYTPAGSRINSGSSNASELTNCHCTSAAADGTLNNIFIQGMRTDGAQGGTTSFDDVTRYWLRVNLPSIAEKDGN